MKLTPKPEAIILKLQKAIDAKSAELEYKNRALEIETALEKVRTVAMAMKRADDMLLICKTISQQMSRLGVKEIRNVQTAIFYESRGTYMNYEYYAKHNRTFITEVDFKNHRIQLSFAKKMMKGPNEEVLEHLKGKKLQDWYVYQKSTNQFADKYLLKAHSLNYYWYSLGPVALGISTYYPLTKGETGLFKRFLKVFELAYRRYLDIEKATAQAKEAQIEAALEKVRAAAMGMHKPEDLASVCKAMNTELSSLGFDNLRNSQIAINNDDKQFYLNYEYSVYDGGSIVKVPYKSHWLVKSLVSKMKKSRNAFFSVIITGKELNEWKRFRIKLGQRKDEKLAKAKAICYYFYSVGNGALGISTFDTIDKDQLKLLERFRNVFALAYKRFSDIENARAQAREAQIEASLEKVRAAAIGMHKPEDLLNVCQILFKEFRALGFESLRNAMINIHNDEKKSFINYDYSDEIGRSTNHLVYDIHPLVEKQIQTIRSANDAFSETYFTGRDLVTWKNFRKRIGEKDDQRLNKSKGLYYYFYSIGIGSIGISTFGPIDEESKTLLKRFRNVFSLSYQRYIDIAKAEAQAREAQLEAALERVRAASLAMRDSSALGGIIYKLYGELTRLDAELDRCFIMIVNPENKGITWWMAGQEGLLAENGFFIQQNQHASHLWYLDCWKKRRKRWQYLLEGKEKRDWDRFGFTKTELTRLPGPVKKFMAGVKKIHLSGSSDQFGSLVTGSFEPLPDEQQEIISRFTIAFNQAYIRFLDLQKAEASAKEAAIELGLERVRARAMAMQHSDELAELVTTVFRELNQLEFALASCIIWIHSPAEKSNVLWITSDEMNKPARPLQIVPFYEPFFTSIIAAWKAKDPKWIFSLTGTEKKKFQTLFFKNYPQLPEALRKPVSQNNQITFSASFNNFGALEVVATEPLTFEKFEILHRFGKVFDSSYTRFNDLQNAEAQAREAQIQLALERVRARTMAMQKSDELPETSHVLFEQMKELGETVEQLTIGIVQEENNVIEISATLHGDTLKKIYLHSIDEPYMMTKVYKAWKTKQKTLIVELKGDELNSYNKYRNKLTNSEMFPTNLGDEHRRIVYAAFFSKGMLALGANEPRPPQSLQLMERFASVFDLTYTRFLDLQKAEAQAREAEIELALERVRSKTMAMHNSEDVGDTVATMFDELVKLDVHTNRCGILIFDEEQWQAEVWTAKSNPAGKATLIIGQLDLTMHPLLQGIYQAWKSREPVFTYTMSGDDLSAYYRAINNTRYYPTRFDLAALPGKEFHTDFYFAEGCIFAFTPDPVTEEADSVFKRFANVFSQTYRRYLDLQKAEAQAREAQIEAALERVRSRSMAMHSSQELKEVALELRKQMGQLGQKDLEVCAIHLYDDEHSFESWSAMKVPGSTNEILQTQARFPNKGIRIVDELMKKYDVGEKDYILVNEGVKSEEWFSVMKEYAPELHASILQALGDMPLNKLKANWSVADFSGGALVMVTYGDPDPFSRNLLRRTANVFEQAYIRFLDLQKAETQTRGAQVEAALERVRSRTMAMHKSEDLSETSVVLFNELKKLGIQTTRSGFGIYDEANQAIQLWLTTVSGQLSDQNVLGSIPLQAHYAIRENYTAWKEDKPMMVHTFSGTEVKDYYQKIGSYLSIPSQKKYPVKLVFSVFFFSEGSLNVMTEEPLTDDENKIMLRFSNVFGLTYRRFLDLQKAEAQAREAQIEAALERVRSRSMAMHKSEELADLSLELVKQVQTLGVATWFCAFNINNDDENNSIEWGSNGQGVFSKYRTPREGVFLRYYEAGQRGESLLVNEIGEDECPAHYEYLCSLPGVGDQLLQMKAAGIPFPKQQIDHVAFFKHGYIIFITYEPVPETHDIFKRFARVFEQSYTRFLDLKNAEAQAREAQIEAALERVRSRSMAMHKSDELLEAGEILFSEMQKLGIESLTAGFVLMDKEEKNGLNYTPDPSTKKIMSLPVIIPHTETIHMQRVVENWKKGTSHYVVEMDEQETIQHQTFIAERSTNFTLNAEQLIAISPARLFLHNFYFKEGYLLIVGGARLSAEQIDIMLRFAKVFQQTYTRFLDLQKAEAQAREAEIELGLERVRARAMAMQKSDELSDLVDTVFKELTKLDFALNWCIINIIDEPSLTNMVWAANPETNKPPESYLMKFEDYPFHHSMLKGYRERKTKHVYVIEGKEKKTYDHYLFNETEWRRVPKAAQDASRAMKRYVATFSFSNFGGLQTVGEEYLSGDNLDILSRFGKVFDLTYTRFNDLQKAEAQAREAQIEAALERVRSRSIGMQKSEELKDVIKVVYEQLVHLNIRLDHAGFVVDYQPKADWHFWIADKQEIPSKITHPYFESVWATQFNNAKEKGEELFVTFLNFEEKNRFYNELLSYVPGLPQASIDFYLNCPALAASTVLLENVGLYIENFEGIPYSDDENIILMRFGKVFQQTYTRFLDLQKAEAQTKEAQIEAALEKVRSRTMAMQSSNELQETAAVLFQEFKKLGTADMQQVTIGIYNEEERVIDFRVTSWANNGEQENRAFRLDMDEPNLVQPAIAAWKAGKKSAVFDLTGEALQGWLNYRSKISGVAISSKDTGGRRVISAAYFSKGHLTISSPQPLSAETIKILERFAAVFDGTYTRFLDLEKAEAQVREAQIEAALERVRSRTLAMQRSDELAETAAVLFQQLIALGIEPNRLYISIIKSEAGESEFWITDEDGSKVSTAFAAEMQENATFLKMYEGWKQQQKSLVIDMQGEELQNYFRHLTSLGVPFKGGLEQKRRVQEIAYFSKGFIGMASPEEQPAATLELLERFAAVFNLTFTRFNDLKIAEAHARQAELDLMAIKEAKLKAEEALSVLQATQKQLVQSEKMASLGELTAGIAHEIQNPLNFVNNFSEVSKELLEEMREAIEKGDTEEAKEIMDDVIQNLEKINHHGKRADGIVKGMLQHSRSSSGVKEPTDINALADEYLRLAYHGLRAKDKSFNATLKTEFDDTIGNISVIPQDIGRVILNLITNAFYAVDEKKKQPPAGYEPAVTVTTRKFNTSSGEAGVVISVKDNGSGVPQHVIDKIFQPFFTTKPTGQGTGLGLSLSYDIVKAHGGELKVDTKDGEGSEFIIQLFL